MTDPKNGLPESMVPWTGELYRMLLEQIPGVTFIATLGSGFPQLYLSPQIETLLGYTPAEWLRNPFLWLKSVHPEDRSRLQSDFARILSSRETALRSVYRLHHRDGRVVSILGEVRIRRDEKTGQALVVQGVGFDVSELRRIQEELQQGIAGAAAPDSGRDQAVSP